MRIFLALFVIFSLNLSANALTNKTLQLQDGSVYLLIFDEPILRYAVGDSSILKTKIITNLFNTKKELVLKPVSLKSTNIIIWTRTGKVYNFDIYPKEKSNEPKIIKITENLSLDKPPMLNENNIFDFKLDIPPTLTEEN